jgi:hypothetical protein
MIPLPISDHIARYCSKLRCDENGKPTGTAFYLRPTDSYLSVDWLNILSGSRQEQIEQVREVISKRLKISIFGRIAVLKIGSICDYVAKNTGDKRILKVLHHPDGEHCGPSHSGIHDMIIDMEIIADLIAEVIEETYPAVFQKTN